MISKYVFTISNYRAALVAALFFGCVVPGTKYLVEVLPPQSMAGLLYVSAGVGLFVILVFRNKLKDSFLRVQKKDYKWFFLATLFGGFLGPAFLTYGINHISGTTAALLLNLEAVLTSLIAWFVFKEHFEKKIVYGMILIVAGCLTLSLNAQAGGGEDTLPGFIFICGACLSWAIDNNATRNISHLDPVLISSFKGLTAGSSNLILGYLIGEKILLGIHIIQISILGFLGIGISLVAFIVSLGKIGTARTGAIFSTAPFIGSLLSIVFLGETLPLPTGLALGLMIGGMWFHFSEDHGHVHSHEELTHTHEHSHDEHHQHSHSLNNSNSEPHTHLHKHGCLVHEHSHFPDFHHQHRH